MGSLRPGAVATDKPELPTVPGTLGGFSMVALSDVQAQWLLASPLGSSASCQEAPPHVRTGLPIPLLTEVISASSMRSCPNRRTVLLRWSCRATR